MPIARNGLRHYLRFWDILLVKRKKKTYSQKSLKTLKLYPTHAKNESCKLSLSIDEMDITVRFLKVFYNVSKPILEKNKRTKSTYNCRIKKQTTNARIHHIVLATKTIPWTLHF